MQTEHRRGPLTAFMHARPKAGLATVATEEPLLQALLREHAGVTSRALHAGEVLFDAGDPFTSLHVVTAGSFKTVCPDPRGLPRMASLQLPGDWLGFEGIAEGSHAWRVEALASARVSSIVYEDLLRAARVHPQLLRRLHAEMGHQMEQRRLQKTELRNLATETRVARFLLQWIRRCELPVLSDAPVVAHLPLARAEIGELLGMTVESVSRAMSRLVRDGVVEFSEGHHRDLRIRDMAALSALAQPTHPPVSGANTPALQVQRSVLTPIAP